MVKDYKAIGKIVELIVKHYYTDERLYALGYYHTDIEEARVRVLMKKREEKRCPCCGILSVNYPEPDRCFACVEIENRRVAIRQEMRLKQQQQQRNVAHA